MATTTPVPMMVRNSHFGPTVFTWGTGSDQFVEWKGSGDDDGGDIQIVPSDLLNNVRFRQAIDRGILVVEESNEEIDRARSAHRSEWEDRVAQQQAASQEVIDQPADEDMLMMSCIAPAGKGTHKLCGENFPVKSRARNEKPPLCSQHQSLARSYVAEETGKRVDGHAEVTWKRVIQTARTRQQS
jgi:hypothetical protein